jgi:hypothetical protein
MQSVEIEHAGFAWTGRHAALLPIEQQIWTMTEAETDQRAIHLREAAMEMKAPIEIFKLNRGSKN